MASETTRDHEEIQRWAREHGATPAVVSRTGGMLRFEFTPESEGSLAPVDWQEFFRVFDEKGLELIYDDKPGSRFHKFVYPETVAAKAERRAPERPARAGQRLQAASPAGRAPRGGARPAASGTAKSAGGTAQTAGGRGAAQPAAAKSAPSAKTARSSKSAKSAKSAPGANRKKSSAQPIAGQGKTPARSRRTAAPPGKAA